MGRNIRWYRGVIYEIELDEGVAPEDRAESLARLQAEAEREIDHALLLIETPNGTKH